MGIGSFVSSLFGGGDDTGVADPGGGSFLGGLWDSLPSAQDVYGGKDPSFLQGLARETISPKGIMSFLGAYNQGQQGKEALSLSDKKFEQEKELLGIKHQYDLEMQKGSGSGAGAAMAKIAAEKAIARLNARMQAAGQGLQALGVAGNNEISAYGKLGDLAQRPLTR